jgi:hypothetical protein
VRGATDNSALTCETLLRNATIPEAQLFGDSANLCRILTNLATGVARLRPIVG